MSSPADSDRVLGEYIRSATPSDALSIARTLEQAGFRAWLVGGCVRDMIRLWSGHTGAKAPADFDLCTDARPEVVARTFRRVIPTGIAHGTVTVVIAQRHFEVTTLRGEKGYTDGRRPDEVFFVSDLAQDLARRDFTVNAMAFAVSTLEVIDPFGGRKDLEQGILRAVGDPLTRFSEDGLRVLRCARFAATLGMQVDPGTQAAMRPSLPSFEKVAGERVREEWLKALSSASPSRAFRLLRSEGLLSVTCPVLYPEGSTQVDRAYEVTCQLLDQADAEPIFRLALFILGALPAGEEPTEQERTRTGALDLSRRLKLSGAEKARLYGLAEGASLLWSRRKELSDPRRLRRHLQKVGVDLLPHVGRLIVQAASEETARAARELERLISEELQRRPPLSIRDLRLTGGDLIGELGMQPGPDVGRLLERLLEVVLDDPTQNQKEELLSLARRLK